MKRINFCAWVLILSCSIFSCKQKSQEQKDLESALEQIDRTKGNFNPQFNMDSAGYFAIQSKYNSGVYSVDSNVLIKRNGIFPFRNEENPSLPFVVSYFDANNKIIGTYSIENPASARTCEEGKEGVHMIDGAIFEILLPANKNIKGYTVSDNGKQLFSRDLPRQIIIENNDDKTRNDKDSINAVN